MYKFVFTVDFETPYFIIDTDYTGYAVAFSCRDMAGLMSGSVYRR